MSTFQVCLRFAIILFSWGVIAKVAGAFLPSLKLIFDKVSKTLLIVSSVLFLLGLSLNTSDLFESLVCFSILLSLFVFFFASTLSCHRSYKKLNEGPERNEVMKALLSLYFAKDKSTWFRKLAIGLKKTQSKTHEVQKDPADWWKDQRGDRFN